LLVLCAFVAVLGVNVLGRGISLLDVTVDEGGDRGSGRVDLILSLGDGELAEKLLKDLDGLGVLAGLGVVSREIPTYLGFASNITFNSGKRQNFRLRY
jgi:hypothetical protein